MNNRKPANSLDVDRPLYTAERDISAWVRAHKKGTPCMNTLWYVDWEFFVVNVATTIVLKRDAVYSGTYQHTQNLLPLSHGKKMETAYSFVMFLLIYQTARRHIPKKPCLSSYILLQTILALHKKAVWVRKT